MAFLTGCNDSSVQNRIYENASALVTAYVTEFNSTDEEMYVQEFDNSEAEQFLRLLQAKLGQIFGNCDAIGFSEGVHEGGFGAGEMLANIV